jgi:cis-3-alkyl-4-acyloxetan-2-one decarboxylase
MKNIQVSTVLHKHLGVPYTLHVERMQWPKKHTATVILIHGIGSSTAMWQSLAKTMPANVRVLAIDLLGHGKSPKPEWARYDARTQARSVLTTLLLHRIPPKCLIVGHSLGALVAVELARIAPLYIKHLLLVSPPIYKPSRNMKVATQREDVLRGVYKILQRYPRNTERGLKLAKKYYVSRAGNEVTPGVNINSYLMTLESAIVNQSAIKHATEIKTPISMISGSRDPLVVNKNLRTLQQQVQGSHLKIVKGGGHNIVGLMKHALNEEIRLHLA